MPNFLYPAGSVARWFVMILAIPGSPLLFTVMVFCAPRREVLLIHTLRVLLLDSPRCTRPVKAVLLL